MVIIMKTALKCIAVVLVLLVAVSSILYYNYFVSMRSLPEGTLVGTYKESEYDSEINIYRCSSGATVDDAIRGEVVFKDGKKKNIYWSYHESDADVKWIDSETVSINGHVLNIHNDKYDFRRE